MSTILAEISELVSYLLFMYEKVYTYLCFFS